MESQNITSHLCFPYSSPPVLLPLFPPTSLQKKKHKKPKKAHWNSLQRKITVFWLPECFDVPSDWTSDLHHPACAPDFALVEHKRHSKCENTEIHIFLNRQEAQLVIFQFIQH